MEEILLDPPDPKQRYNQGSGVSGKEHGVLRQGIFVPGVMKSAFPVSIKIFQKS
jgi:hypothetical protein